MFLKIENPGVCPVEGFTVLGLSTARGNADKIGQFGSGAKHGVLTCLRSGIIPQIYLGHDKLEFATEKANMQGKEYNRVLYSFQGNVERTSMALEFGGLDWNGVDMGLREFVSNALDSVESHKDIVVGIVRDVEPLDNTTRVFLPLLPEVNRFFSELPSKFLQFKPDYDANQRVMVKLEPGNCRFYRKGVFVRESQTAGLFDYNCGDDIKIDESRNLDSYAISGIAGKLIATASVDILKFIFSNLPKLDKTFESTLSEWNFLYMAGKHRDNWKTAFQSIHGENVFIAETSQGPLVNMAVKKGKKVVIIPSTAFYKALEACGVKTIVDAVEGVDKSGRQTKPAGVKLIARMIRIWNKLQNNGLTADKTMPAIKVFRQIMSGESLTAGYYSNGTIFINEEHATNNQTILEELAHHITGSTDNSRDFQDYAFKVATVFMGKSKT